MKYIITENRMTKLISKMVEQVFPKFNNRDTIVSTYSNGGDSFLEYYSSDHPGKTFAKYYVWTQELRLNRELFHKLEDYFGEEKMSFILDWFNKEFGQDADHITL
jgi:hypothetical protein